MKYIVYWMVVSAWLVSIHREPVYDEFGRKQGRGKVVREYAYDTIYQQKEFRSVDEAKLFEARIGMLCQECIFIKTDSVKIE